MEFFNRQEEVIDLQLTQYGKWLLSLGRFKPVYYAFFDDDITYDNKYAGKSERQNATEPRIKDAVRPKAQYTWTGLETQVKKINREIREKVLSGESSIEKELRNPRIQPVAEKLHALSMPIGTTSLSTHKAPAWNAKIYEPSKVQGQVKYLTGSGAHTQRIPQLNFNALYQTTFDSLTGDEAPHGGVGSEPDAIDDAEPVFLDYGDILIRLTEENTDFLKENVDIEVFLVEEEIDPNIPEGRKENLIPLSFARYDNININSVAAGGSLEKIMPDLNTSYSDYFLDISVDEQIDPDIFCKYVPRDPTEGVFTDASIKCPGAPGPRRNIYTTNEEFEEPCD